MAIKTEIKGKQLVITIDMQEPTESSSGKSMVVASTHGNIPAGTDFKGKALVVSVNAYYKK